MRTRTSEAHIRGCRRWAHAGGTCVEPDAGLLSPGGRAAALLRRGRRRRHRDHAVAGLPLRRAAPRHRRHLHLAVDELPGQPGGAARSSRSGRSSSATSTTRTSPRSTTWSATCSSDRVDLVEARTALARIVSSGHNTPRWAITLGWGVMCAGVALLLGGSLTVDRDRLRRRGLHRPAAAADGAPPASRSSTSRSPAGASRRCSRWARRPPGLDVDPSLVVTANIVMLLAGIGFMGALQDALSGFYVTAGARLTEALLSTAGIIAGVSGGLSLGQFFGVSIGQLDPGFSSWESVTMVALGSAICAGAFAFACYAPPRIIAPIALISAVAVVISQTITLQGFSRAWATGAGGVLHRSGQLHGRRPGAGAAAGRRGLGGGADAARPLDLPRPRAARRGRLDRPPRACWRWSPPPRSRSRLLRRDPGGVRRPAAQARGAPLESRLAGPRLVGPLRVRTGRAERRERRARRPREA